MTKSVIRLTSRPCAATPITQQHQTAIDAHQTAENALSMALHYLRASASNIPGATRKAVQALAALHNLHALTPAGAGTRVHISGRV